MIAPRLARLAPWTAPAEVLTVVVEIPKGSRNKYEIDHETGTIFLDRMFFTRCSIPRTTGSSTARSGADGDPLDALVFVGEPTFPGCHIAPGRWGCSG